MSVFLNQSHVDELIRLLDEEDKIRSKIRDILAGGVQSKTPKNGTILDIDVSGIQFYLKNKQPAGGDSSWAWCWAKNQDGSYKHESKELVQYLEQYAGKVTIGSFEYSLGGNGGRFLNRRKP